MQAWIQSADLSSRDMDVDAEGAMRAFSSHDWAGESARARQLEADGEEWCPAGLGLVRGDGHVLHLCPDGVTLVVHWQRPASGFFSRTPAPLTWEHVPYASVPSLIRHFYGNDDAALEQALVG